MAKYYDAELVKILQKYLHENSKVLELGMGVGNDMDILKKSYTVTGSHILQVY